MGAAVTRAVNCWVEEQSLSSDLADAVHDAVKVACEGKKKDRPHLVKDCEDDPGVNEAAILSCLPPSLAAAVHLQLFQPFLDAQPLVALKEASSFTTVLTQHVLPRAVRIAVPPGAPVSPPVLASAGSGSGPGSGPGSPSSHGDAEPLPPGLYCVRSGSVMARDVGRNAHIIPAGSVVDVSAVNPELTVVSTPPTDGSSHCTTAFLDSIRVSLRGSAREPSVLSFIPASVLRSAASSDADVSAAFDGQVLALASVAQSRTLEKQAGEVAERLLTAIEDGDLAVVTKLLGTSGVDPSTWRGTSYMPSPLQAAISGGDIEVVKVLLDAGAPVDAVDFAGRTALALLCSDKKTATPDLFHLILSHSTPSVLVAPSPVPGDNGNTPVHNAAKSGSAPLLRAVGQVLALHRLDGVLTALNQQGRTPLDFCSSLTLKRCLKPKGDKGGAARIR